MQLLCIWQALPFAAATYTKVLAERLTALVRILMELDDLSFGIAVFFATYLQVYHITWYCIRNKYYEIVDFCNSLTLSSYVGDGYIFKDR